MLPFEQGEKTKYPQNRSSHILSSGLALGRTKKEGGGKKVPLRDIYGGRLCFFADRTASNPSIRNPGVGKRGEKGQPGIQKKKKKKIKLDCQRLAQDPTGKKKKETISKLTTGHIWRGPVAAGNNERTRLELGGGKIKKEREERTKTCQ